MLIVNNALDIVKADIANAVAFCFAVMRHLPDGGFPHSGLIWCQMS